MFRDPNSFLFLIKSKLESEKLRRKKIFQLLPLLEQVRGYMSLVIPHLIKQEG